MIDYQSQIWAKELSKSIWGKKEGMINYQLQIGRVRGNDRIDGLWKHNHLRLEKVSSMHSLTPGRRLWSPVILVPIPEMRMHMATKAVMEQQWLLSNDTLHATMFLQPKSCWKWEFAYGNGSSIQRSSNCCAKRYPACMQPMFLQPKSHQILTPRCFQNKRVWSKNWLLLPYSLRRRIGFRVYIIEWVLKSLKMEHYIHVCTAGSAVLMMAHEWKKRKQRMKERKTSTKKLSFNFEVSNILFRNLRTDSRTPDVGIENFKRSLDL